MAANSARQSPGYNCEPADLARDREEILSIWRGNLGNELSLAGKYDWFYVNSEAGSPIAKFLRHADTDKRVGFASAGPRRATWKDRSVRIGVLVDMAVMPEHRSLYPALLLQRSLQQAVPGDLAALYGFPNPRAVPVFARAGYSRVLDVRRFVRVLRPGTYLRRRFPGWAGGLLGRPIDLLMRAWDVPWARRAGTFTARWRTGADPRVDELWKTTPHGDGPIVVRDMNFLRWRFDQKPGTACRYLVVEARDGSLAGWFACQDDRTTLVVQDFWTSRGYDGLDPSILWLLLREARRGGYSAVSVEFGGFANIIRALETAGFSERGRRPFFAYFGSEQALARDAAWYVTSADEDE